MDDELGPGTGPVRFLGVCGLCPVISGFSVCLASALGALLAAAPGIVRSLDRENPVIEGHLNVLLPYSGKLGLELVVIAQIAEVSPEGLAGFCIVTFERIVDVIRKLRDRTRKAPYDIENSRSSTEIIIIEL